MKDKTTGHDSRAVANRFVELAQGAGKPVTIMQLVKFVYLAHGWHLGFTDGKPLICHSVQAWRHGPVIPEVYKAFRPQGVVVFQPALQEEPPHDRYASDFSPRESELIGNVFRAYSKISAFALSALTHEPGTPWDQVKGNGYYAPIPNGIIAAYYKEKAKEHSES